MAVIGTCAAFVDMFMRRAVFEARLLDLASDLRNTAKELNARCDTQTQALKDFSNSVIRIQNKLGM